MNFHDGDEDAGALCCVTAVLCLLAHLAVLGRTARLNISVWVAMMMLLLFGALCRRRASRAAPRISAHLCASPRIPAHPRALSKAASLLKLCTVEACPNVLEVVLVPSRHLANNPPLNWLLPLSLFFPCCLFVLMFHWFCQLRSGGLLGII